MAASSPAPLVIARIAVKVVAIVIGAVGTVIGLMSLVGLVVETGWVRVPVAVVVALGLPAFLADRLLPDDDPKKGAGLPSDVYALLWLGFTVAYVVGAGAYSRPWLLAEADRLASSGAGWLAKPGYWLAGAEPKPAAPTAEPPALASASASALASSAPPPPSASAAPEAAATDPVDAGAEPEAPDAGAEPVPEGDLTPAELFKRYAPSVVTVSIKRGPHGGGGTGFLIDDSGTIATNHHVIAGAQRVRVKFMGGATYEEVELLAEDSSADLALLKVELGKPTSGDAPEGVSPLRLGDSDAIKVGEPAASIGNPLGLEHTLTDGLISARRTYQGKQWIQTSVPISPGNSGGPLFDMRGEVIGVSTATVGAIFGQNLNLAVPINVLKQQIQSTYPGRKKFGKGSSSGHW